MVLAKYGVSAYGFSVPTGQDNQRGSAPGGLQSAYWTSLVAFLASIGLHLTADNYREFFTDTFRSYHEQQTLYDEKPGLAARPGTSIHGIGFAVDWNNDRPDWPKIQYALQHTGSKFGIVHPFDDPTREEWHWQLVPGFKLSTKEEDVYCYVTVNFGDAKEARDEAAQANIMAGQAGAIASGFTDDYHGTVAVFSSKDRAAGWIRKYTVDRPHNVTVFCAGKFEVHRAK